MVTEVVGERSKIVFAILVRFDFMPYCTERTLSTNFSSSHVMRGIRTDRSEHRGVVATCYWCVSNIEVCMQSSRVTVCSGPDSRQLPWCGSRVENRRWSFASEEPRSRRPSSLCRKPASTPKHTTLLRNSDQNISSRHSTWQYVRASEQGHPCAPSWYGLRAHLTI